MSNKFKKAFAFTLAETLIVIGVIGIVSALTLPNLNSSTGDKERVAKVKKIYQNLNDAFGRAESVYGSYDEWFVNDGNDATKKTNRAGERITEFIKISKNCGQTANKGCFSGTDDSNDDYKFITVDGTSVGFRVKVDNDTGIFVDIDGPNKGSNANGKDRFFFVVDLENHTITPSNTNLTFENLVKACYNGNSAENWILKYDNADYLQFVDNTGKCKNGNTVSEANPRCK